MRLFCNQQLAQSCRLCAYAGKGNKEVVVQMLHKSESVEAHGRHGNPFSEDGSNEGRHDNAPLLIGSADSSYAMDSPRR